VSRLRRVHVGVAFFQEGRFFYDMKRDRIYSSWERDEFYVSPHDVDAPVARFERRARNGCRPHSEPASALRSWPCV
jgi:hypothetical protein